MLRLLSYYPYRLCHILTGRSGCASLQYGTKTNTNTIKINPMPQKYQKPNSKLFKCHTSYCIYTTE